MRRLCTLLGMPQHRFASIHVVGTNGKTSVALMTAALLEAHGVRTGAYVSPHVVSWRERIWIGGEQISQEAFAAAVERSAEAAETANRAAGEEGPVTQFELDTAAAFVAFAAARVQVAVIEAGLGGRLDATNVIPSQATVLTSVGLDHTEWLGGTVEEIAAEKLAVLRDHTTLICGPVPDRVKPVIERVVAERHATRLSPVGTQARGPRGYQHANAALALTAAAEVLDPDNLDPHVSERALAGFVLPGRAQFVEGDPDLIYDAAHNPDGARALAESLPELTADHPVIACVAVLAEKDAAGICAALAPACERAICTEFPDDAVRGSGRPVGEAIPAASLAQLWRQAGGQAEVVADPLVAWAQARELAAERGGVALAAGSHYLLRTLWTERQDQSS
jgi:dihydrofolate synthase/folylpolyglutamate synthase